MKKASKYNLLSKDEPLKEKDQQEWIEMESTTNWKNKQSENHDTSYMKLDDEISEIEGDNLHLNSGNHNSSYSANLNQKSQPYKQPNYQNVQKLPTESVPNQKPTQQQRQLTSTSAIQPPHQMPVQDQRGRQTSQIPIQTPMNPYNSQYMVPSPYAKRSLIPSSFVSNHFVPNIGPMASNYTLMNRPVMYSQYQPQGYMNQGNYQSQYQPNTYQQPMNNQPQYQPQYQNNPMNSTVSQSYQNQPTVSQNISRSTMSQMNRSSFRSSVPEMTVNCGKCTFTQTVPGDSQMFICCMCNEIDECFPLYGIFTCGICKAKVIYPHGTSTLIKCTKCQTVNRVNPEPRKREDENVAVGKQQIQEQEPILSQQQIDYELREQKMRRDEPQEYPEYKLPPKNMRKNTQQPFKILPAQKIQQKEEKQQEVNLYPDIQIPNDEKRQFSDKNKQFSEELIELGSSSKDGQCNENLHKEIFELSQKLHESVVIGKEEDILLLKVQISHPNQPSSPFKPTNKQNLETFPSIFD